MWISKGILGAKVNHDQTAETVSFLLLFLRFIYLFILEREREREHEQA